MLGLYLDLLDLSNYVDIANRRTKTRQRNTMLRRSLWCYNENMFQKKYRLSKSLFFDLVEELRSQMPPPGRSDALDLETKVLITLSFFATGSYQTRVGDNRYHAVSQATVSKVVNEITEALNKPEILNKFVKFPFITDDREKIKKRFHEATYMLGAIGCIDGTHVAIVSPSLNSERYINRNGYHSLNVLIMCDSDLNIMAVDSSHPGSTNDSKVWEDNPLKGVIDKLYEENQEDIYILGDSEYPLSETLMTPILNAPPETPEAYYTDLHTTASSIVERCIGALKARFRCLLVNRKLYYRPAVAAKIVKACCVLHNIAQAAGIVYEPLAAQVLNRELRLAGSASPPTAGEVITAYDEQQLCAGRGRRNRIVSQLWQQRHEKVPTASLTAET